jgi:hypothetical protein
VKTKDIIKEFEDKCEEAAVNGNLIKLFKKLIKKLPKGDCIGTKNQHKMCHYNDKGICTVHHKRK